MPDFDAALANSEFTAWRQIAPVVHEALKTEAGGSGKVPSPNSIATKLSDLRKGKHTWWRKRPVAVASLAEALGVQPRDLGLEDATDPALRSTEFPQLRPLTELMELARVGTFSEKETDLQQGWPLWHSPDDEPSFWFMKWLIVPRGWGTSTVARLLPRRGSLTIRHSGDSRRPVELIDADTLSEAADLVGRREQEVGRGELFPVWLVFIRALGDSPGSHLARLNPITGLNELGSFHRREMIVVAPVSPAEAVEPLKRARESHTVDWRFLRVEQVRWRSGGRRELLHTVQDRAPKDSLLDATSVADWLETNDPDNRVFDTPATVLALAEFAHRRGERELGQASSEVLEQMASRRLEHGHREIAMSRLRSAHARLFLDPRQPWKETHQREAWAAAVATNEVAIGVSSRSDLEQNALVWWVHASAKQVVRRLLEHGVLSPHPEMPGIRVSPTALGDLWASEHAATALEEGPAKWGRLAFDLDRTPSIDAALEGLEGTEIAKAYADAMELPDGPARQGAVDSLFLEVARRIVTQDGPPLQAADCLALAEEALRHLENDPLDQWFSLRTRSGRGTDKVQTRLRVACWALGSVIDTGAVVQGWLRAALDLPGTELRLPKYPDNLSDAEWDWAILFIANRAARGKAFEPQLHHRFASRLTAALLAGRGRSEGMIGEHTYHSWIPLLPLIRKLTETLHGLGKWDRLRTEFAEPLSQERWDDQSRDALRALGAEEFDRFARSLATAATDPAQTLFFLGWLPQSSTFEFLTSLQNSDPDRFAELTKIAPTEAFGAERSTAVQVLALAARAGDSAARQSLWHRGPDVAISEARLALQENRDVAGWITTVNFRVADDLFEVVLSWAERQEAVPSEVLDRLDYFAPEFATFADRVWALPR